MPETEKKISQLRKKISAKESRCQKLIERITQAKSEIKLIRKEIDEMTAEVRMLELNQLGDALTQNGITAEEIQAAIAAGLFEKSATKTDTADCAICSTNENAAEETIEAEQNEQEVTENEVSGS